jgi:hypothetical protein
VTCGPVNTLKLTQVVETAARLRKPGLSGSRDDEPPARSAFNDFPHALDATMALPAFLYFGAASLSSGDRLSGLGRVVDSEQWPRAWRLAMRQAATQPEHDHRMMAPTEAQAAAAGSRGDHVLGVNVHQWTVTVTLK